MSNKVRTIAFAFLAAIGGMACSSGGDPIDTAMNKLLDGTWRGMDVIIEFENDQAIVSDFGSSTLGSNPSVFKLGDALVDDIRCDDVSCTGQMISPQFVDGILQSYNRREILLEQNGNTLTFVYPDTGNTIAWTRVDAFGGAVATVGKSSSCAEWWTAVTSVGTWNVTHIENWNGYQGPVSDLQVRFSGANRYEFIGNQGIGDAVLTGTIHFDENFFSTGYCRFVWWSDSGFQMRVWFMDSLSGGELRANLSYDHSLEYWLLKAN